MSTPNRYQIKGNFKFVGMGTVLDVHTGKEFEAELRFTADTPGIETSTNKAGENKAKINLDIVKDGTDLWSIVVFDQEESNVN